MKIATKIIRSNEEHARFEVYLSGRHSGTLISRVEDYKELTKILTNGMERPDLDFTTYGKDNPHKHDELV